MTPDERLKLVVGDLMVAKTFYEARVAELLEEIAKLRRELVEAGQELARLAASELAKAPVAEDDGA